MNGQSDRPDETNVGDLDDQQPVAESTDEAPANDADAAAEEPTDRVAELEAQVDENWQKYLRAAAELDNVRKRAARDVEKAHKFALERFANDLLEVRDSLEMGLAAADADADSLRQGKEATLKQLTTVMARYGVEEVDPLGEPFDPELHEAMTMQPSADAEPGSVLAVFQKGYALNGRLLRPARVVVAAEADGE